MIRATMIAVVVLCIVLWPWATPAVVLTWLAEVMNVEAVRRRRIWEARLHKIKERKLA
jgi:hypothetical protein